MSADVFESKPRWPGAPKICLYENLPAFAEWKDAAKFLETNAPGCSVLEKWQCSRCDCWHYITDAPAPAGSSSGTKRHFAHKPPQYRKDKP